MGSRPGDGIRSLKDTFFDSLLLCQSVHSPHFIIESGNIIIIGCPIFSGFPGVNKIRRKRRLFRIPQPGTPIPEVSFLGASVADDKTDIKLTLKRQTKYQSFSKLKELQTYTQADPNCSTFNFAQPHQDFQHLLKIQS